MTLQVDASDSAIGVVIFQEGHPVCFTSHTLGATDKNYAQIEKGCLAVVSCMEKWHHYLYEKHDLTVHSDHQPLETIFKKPLSRVPQRLQRMMLRLQNYHFTVQCIKKGKSSLWPTLCLAQLSVMDPSHPPEWRKSTMYFVGISHIWTCHQTLSNLVQWIRSERRQWKAHP